ncbi:CerR family C-terminal domain-containing protein [Paraburkholderia oxyphila]|uniref:CerR family C-terminal domain-containing protein n=1 Tax=Paraburkholderia oxyphila TaxID=614212 RepID=UPI000484FD5A|nr:CerR family C-terminal domain-containing protein [Paraburkholderia oxyphila]
MRRAVENGYARGHETRARIISAALTLFGAQGFDGASTRDIAESAGVNAPALLYYFGNKEGVYLACVEHIATTISNHLATPLDAAQVMLAADASDEELIEAFRSIQDCLKRYLFTSTEPDSWRLFMAREQAGLGPLFKDGQVSDRLQTRILPMCSAIVRRLMGCKTAYEESMVRAIAITGQLVSIHLTRQSVASALGWKSIDADRVEQIFYVIDEQTVTLLKNLADKKRVSKS